MTGSITPFKRAPAVLDHLETVEKKIAEKADEAAVARKRMRHIKDPYNKPYKIFHEKLLTSTSEPLSDFLKERARKLSLRVRIIQMHNTEPPED
jgi:hypothetical protein